jgi:2-oxoglutarate/2-oxoacid ferredoxin oxidoreductase subunit beta
MSYVRPLFRHPNLPKNEMGYTKADYEGKLSTLCAGCGHDSISAAIVQACFELNVEPHHVAKLSGIGCSSKTPAYYLGNSHGFNSVHGRMPSVATGASMVNGQLKYFGVSGDGDSASIGIGQFVHVIRRNLNMVYLVMNNGCYGLTKGQHSATADVGSYGKERQVNPFQPIDLASLAIELGASFVAQSFSGDKQQLVPLVKAAMEHRGFAFINVISPCVTFNNNVGSTKSYDYVREHITATATVDFVPHEEEIAVQYDEGQGKEITLYDGSLIKLQKLTKDWNPLDRLSAASAMQTARSKGEILTGLLYIDEKAQNQNETYKTSTRALNSLTEKELCPGSDVLESLMEGLR